MKEKLIWLGKHSYLFRHCFRDYLESEGTDESDIDAVDEFVCRVNTCWSGLGVTDVLAGLLELSDAERRDLKSWYERHLAFFRVEANDGTRLNVLNLVNERPYTVHTAEFSPQFSVGSVIFGALVPWHGEWYWSGTQKCFDALDEEVVRQTRRDMILRSSRIVYRYCEDLAEIARSRTLEHHQRFIGYHGADLVTYPDGYAMAADMQRRHRRFYESLPQERVAEAMAEHGLSHPWPRLSYPEHLLERSDGIGVFHNPDEGEEIMSGFEDLVSGFEKRGMGLTSDEEQVLRGFITLEAISPRFVRRMTDEHGQDSILAAFLIPSGHESYALEYLLRRHKGHFFRKRYPCLSLVMEEDSPTP